MTQLIESLLRLTRLAQEIQSLRWWDVGQTG